MNLKTASETFEQGLLYKQHIFYYLYVYLVSTPTLNLKDWTCYQAVQ